MTRNNYGTNVSRRRRLWSLFAVLLVIALVMIVAVGISLGPAVPPYPINPGQQASPPAENTTESTPSLTNTNSGVSYSVTICPIWHICLPKTV